MPGQLESDLARWQAAGLLTPDAAERIRRFENSATTARTRLRWPILVAIGAGALMLGAGVLLFVSARWDGLSQGSQFALVLLLVGSFHLAGAAASRFTTLATACHALGTAALGAGIFLAARIFNLQSDWPSGVLLWAAGAGIAWLLRHDWTQVLFIALLSPIWLVGQWMLSTDRYAFEPAAAPLAGMLLLSLAYLWAESPGASTTTRRLLTALGASAVLPLGITTGLFRFHPDSFRGASEAGTVAALGWVIFLGVPLLLGWLLRGRDSWPLLIAALWVWLRAGMPDHSGLLPFLWGAAGALGLTAAGVHNQSRIRVNLGVAGFALTVMLFYFSSVMDKLGRSASLMVGGVLFLAGGWLLERLRRRLVASVSTGEAAG